MTLSPSDWRSAIPRWNMDTAWTEDIGRRARASWSWLWAWRQRTPLGDAGADSHLWAEGPLPQRLARCLNCDSVRRDSRADAVPRQWVSPRSEHQDPDPGPLGTRRHPTN